VSLDWPTGFDRTGPSRRARDSRFQASIADTTAAIQTEMDRLDPSSWRAAIANEHTKTSGLPLHNANPDDPGFVLRWTKDGEDFAVACDHYEALRDNLRTVLLWVRETRKRGQRPVETGASEFAAARLPPADDGPQDALSARAPPHDILDVAPDADPKVVEAAYREKLKAAHPDNGGSQTDFQRVRDAKEAMLDE
jgi:hypothetical protein